MRQAAHVGRTSKARLASAVLSTSAGGSLRRVMIAMPPVRSSGTQPNALGWLGGPAVTALH
jgi:hypothetical protein